MGATQRNPYKKGRRMALMRHSRPRGSVCRVSGTAPSTKKKSRADERTRLRRIGQSRSDIAGARASGDPDGRSCFGVF